MEDKAQNTVGSGESTLTLKESRLTVSIIYGCSIFNLQGSANRETITNIPPTAPLQKIPVTQT